MVLTALQGEGDLAAAAAHKSRRRFVIVNPLWNALGNSEEATPFPQNDLRRSQLDPYGVREVRGISGSATRFPVFPPGRAADMIGTHTQSPQSGSAGGYA